MTSIFTKIINHEIPASFIYEDAYCVAFLDINPVQFWHTLVVPKKEIQRLYECPDDLVAHLFVVAKKIMHVIKTTLWADFVYIGVMWTEIPHVHIHVIPLGFEKPFLSRSTTTYPLWSIESHQQLLIDGMNSL
jgi:histidine triad (HIT) family protein